MQQSLCNQVLHSACQGQKACNTTTKFIQCMSSPDPPFLPALAASRCGADASKLRSCCFEWHGCWLSFLQTALSLTCHAPTGAFLKSSQSKSIASFSPEPELANASPGLQPPVAGLMADGSAVTHSQAHMLLESLSVSMSPGSTQLLMSGISVLHQHDCTADISAV